MLKFKGSKKHWFYNASSSFKEINQNCKKSPVEDEEIEIIGTRPANGRIFHQLAET